MRRAVHADAQRIRTFFLERKESYGLADAARLLDISPGVLRREAEADDASAYQTNGRWRFRWRQLAHIALRRWILSQIHDALGSDAAAVLPSLLAFRRVEVRLPEYLARAIEHAAAEDQTSVDDWLHQELLDFASGMVQRMERTIPGFRRAYLFPGAE